jgi:hypothetical protein
MPKPSTLNLKRFPKKLLPKRRKKKRKRNSRPV